jgi:8-oxo-dGTP pyrophosphatase MutT (NUDIX family)
MQLSSFVIIENNNNYLLVREATGKWFFPGGKANKDEDPVSAVIREAKEEARCNIILDGIVYLKLEKKILTDRMHIYYNGRIHDIDHYKTSSNAKWFSYDEVLTLPLRDGAIYILDIFRALTTTLPIYNFKFIKAKRPYKIREKDFFPF